MVIGQVTAKQTKCQRCGKDMIADGDVGADHYAGHCGKCGKPICYECGASWDDTLVCADCHNSLYYEYGMEDD